MIEWPDGKCDQTSLVIQQFFFTIHIFKHIQANHIITIGVQQLMAFTLNGIGHLGDDQIDVMRLRII